MSKRFRAVLISAHLAAATAAITLGPEVLATGIWTR